LGSWKIIFPALKPFSQRKSRGTVRQPFAPAGSPFYRLSAAWSAKKWFYRQENDFTGTTDG
jgi:hypothetical protein